jgi:hypothetical protein
MFYVVSDGTVRKCLVLAFAALSTFFAQPSAAAAIPATLTASTANVKAGTLKTVARPVGLFVSYLTSRLNKQVVVKTRYVLNRPVASGECSIILVLQFSKRRATASTLEYVRPEHWDKARHRVADRYLDQFPEYLETNRVLDELEQLLSRQYNQYRREMRLDQFTPGVINQIISERLHGVQGETDLETVLVYYQSLLTDRARSGNLSESTLSGERSTLRHFERFSAARTSPVLFSDVKLSLFEQFRDYLWGAGVTTDSSVHKNVRRFRQVLLHAEASGIDMPGAVASISLRSQLGLSSAAMDTIALTESDLRTLADMPLLGNIKLRRTRDLFLCGCYTGLRVNRWGEINQDNLIELDGVKMLQLFTAKGRRKSVTIPVHPVLLSTLEQHDYILPKVQPGHQINKNLKQLCRLAGFTDKIELARNVHGKSVVQTYERCQLITTHTARRWFATNAFAAGIPKDDIRAMTGQTMKTLEHYIKEDGRHRAQRLGRSEWFSKK